MDWVLTLFCRPNIDGEGEHDTWYILGGTQQLWSLEPGAGGLLVSFVPISFLKPTASCSRPPSRVARDTSLHLVNGEGACKI